MVSDAQNPDTMTQVSAKSRLTANLQILLSGFLKVSDFLTLPWWPFPPARRLRAHARAHATHAHPRTHPRAQYAPTYTRAGAGAHLCAHTHPCVGGSNTPRAHHRARDTARVGATGGGRPFHRGAGPYVSHVPSIFRPRTLSKRQPLPGRTPGLDQRWQDWTVGNSTTL